MEVRVITTVKRAVMLSLGFVVGVGCGEPQEQTSDIKKGEREFCAPKVLPKRSGLHEGVGHVFNVDPMVSSGDALLSPSSVRLDEFKSEVSLQFLDGNGTLSGKYVDVRNFNHCQGEYGAFDLKNQFLFSYSQPAFRETMTYYYGSEYRSLLAELGLLDVEGAGPHGSPITLMVHCGNNDDAFYVRNRNQNGEKTQLVCIGNSGVVPGASYADDASVPIHELQHATTVDSYSTEVDLNQFWYDEAGAINEAISDFMALGFLEPRLGGNWDPLHFSRWALGTFNQSGTDSRGAHRCPRYDPSFPQCGGYQLGAAGFSAEENRVSFSYPDGLGWPHAHNFLGPGYVRSAFESFGGKEQIHTNSVVVTGALWDAYRAIGGKDARADFAKMASMIMKTLMILPKPSSGNRAPVTIPAFFETLTQVAGVTLSETEVTSFREALRLRGVGDLNRIEANWAQVGPGSTKYPGLYIEDDATVLKSLIERMRGDSKLVPPTLLVDGYLEPGEMGLVWFDILNQSNLTAGGVVVTVEALTEGLIIADGSLNIGKLDPRTAQFMVAKINGKEIVQALTSSHPSYDVLTSNTYFSTHPSFWRSPTTGIFVQIAKTVPKGTELKFKVKIRAANQAGTDPEQVLEYTLKVR